MSPHNCISSSPSSYCNISDNNVIIDCFLDRICSVMTHLIFFSVEPTPQGGIIGMDRFPSQEVLDDARNQGCQLIICFGGNGRSSGFSKMTRDDETRNIFVKKVKKLLKKFKLDGVDYNWEYPGYGFGTGYHSPEEVKKDYDGLFALVKVSETSGNVLSS